MQILCVPYLGSRLITYAEPKLLAIVPQIPPATQMRTRKLRKYCLGRIWYDFKGLLLTLFSSQNLKKIHFPFFLKQIQIFSQLKNTITTNFQRICRIIMFY